MTLVTAPPKPRILLVDDEEGFCRVMAKRLSRRGFEPLCAFSGSHALGLLRGHDVDVAVLDLKMEDMDGLELLKTVKSMVPDLPVILLTGHGSDAAARDGLALGAAAYLLKPCDLDDLLERIAVALEEESCRR